MIKNVSIENFTAFEKLDLDLSPRVNVIIGSNGTGKTHLLKAIYGLGVIAHREFDVHSKDSSAAAISSKFLRLFSTEDERVGNLHARGATSQARLSLLNGDDSSVEMTFGNRSQYLEVESQAIVSGHALRPVYIPTKEVLSLVRGIRHPDHDRATVEMIFDDGYIDLAEQLVRPSFDEGSSDPIEDPRLSNIIRELVVLVGGRYRWKDKSGFSFETGRYEEKVRPKTDPSRSDAQIARAYQDSTSTRFVAKGGQAFSSGMTAEGYRKIGVLHRLLCNGSINPGETGVLLWDEPEANLNPRLMKKLVQVLLELSRNGQQIIIATHDYVLLKWLDLLMDQGKEDHVRFHAIYQNPDTRRMAIESADSYSLISKTAISDTFAELFDEDMARALGGTKP